MQYCMYDAQGHVVCGNEKKPLYVNNLGKLDTQSPTDRTWKVIDPNPVCNVDMPFCSEVGKTMDCKLDYCKRKI